MRRIYIDQLHLRPRPGSLIPELRRRARAGEFRAPVSIAHALDTMRDRPDRRAETQAALVDLSQNEVLLTETAMHVVEAAGSREKRDHDWVRARAISTSMWDYAASPRSPIWLRLARRIVPATPAHVFRGLAFFGDARPLSARVQPILEDGATKGNLRRGNDPSWSELLTSIGATDLASTRSESEVRRVFRTIATRRALHDAIWERRATGLDPNDLVDLTFLAVALPYLDAVVVDRRMLARIEDARGAAGIPWAKAFRRLDELVAWLDASPP